MVKKEMSGEFSRIVKESQKKGAIQDWPAEKERRSFHRLKIAAKDMWIDSVAEFSIIDMSPSGIALQCNHPIDAGQTLKLSVGRGAHADAKVIACDMEEAPSEHLDGVYRIHCRFSNETQGMELLLGLRKGSKG